MLHKLYQSEAIEHSLETTVGKISVITELVSADILLAVHLSLHVELRMRQGEWGVDLLCSQQRVWECPEHHQWVQVEPYPKMTGAFQAPQNSSGGRMTKYFCGSLNWATEYVTLRITETKLINFYRANMQHM